WARLPAVADALAKRLVALLDSTRPDRGAALLVGMARLAALDRTLATGRWVLLDAFPPDAPALDTRQVTRQREATGPLAAEAWCTFAGARARLVAAADDAAPEPGLAAVETAGNRALELAGALDGGRPLRMHVGALVPVGRTTQPPAVSGTTPERLE